MNTNCWFYFLAQKLYRFWAEILKLLVINNSIRIKLGGAWRIDSALGMLSIDVFKETNNLYVFAVENFSCWLFMPKTSKNCQMFLQVHLNGVRLNWIELISFQSFLLFTSLPIPCRKFIFRLHHYYIF